MCHSLFTVISSFASQQDFEQQKLFFLNGNRKKGIKKLLIKTGIYNRVLQNQLALLQQEFKATVYNFCFMCYVSIMMHRN